MLHKGVETNRGKCSVLYKDIEVSYVSGFFTRQQCYTHFPDWSLFLCVWGLQLSEPTLENDNSHFQGISLPVTLLSDWLKFTFNRLHPLFCSQHTTHTAISRNDNPTWWKSWSELYRNPLEQTRALWTHGRERHFNKHRFLAIVGTE